MEIELGWPQTIPMGAQAVSTVCESADREGPVTDQSVKPILQWPNLPSTPPHNEPTPRPTRLVERLAAQLRARITFALSPHRANSD
jgi:hypothetical protein